VVVSGLFRTLQCHTAQGTPCGNGLAQAASQLSVECDGTHVGDSEAGNQSERKLPARFGTRVARFVTEAISRDGVSSSPAVGINGNSTADCREHAGRTPCTNTDDHQLASHAVDNRKFSVAIPSGVNDWKIDDCWPRLR